MVQASLTQLLLLLTVSSPCSAEIDIQNKDLRKTLNHFNPPTGEVNLSCPINHYMAFTSITLNRNYNTGQYMLCVVCQHTTNNSTENRLKACHDHGLAASKYFMPNSYPWREYMKIRHTHSHPDGLQTCGMTFGRMYSMSLLDFYTAGNPILCAKPLDKEGQEKGRDDMIRCPNGQPLQGILIYPQSGMVKQEHVITQHCVHCLDRKNYAKGNGSSPGMFLCEAKVTKWTSSNNRIYQCLAYPCLTVISHSLRGNVQKGQVLSSGYIGDDKYCGFRFNFSGPGRGTDPRKSIELFPCSPVALPKIGIGSLFQLDFLHLGLLILLLTCIVIMGYMSWIILGARSEERKGMNLELSGGKSGKETHDDNRYESVYHYYSR